MTNGEKIKEIFPNGVLTSINNSYYWGDDILVSKNWWNAEYKEPNKSEKPASSQEPRKGHWIKGKYKDTCSNCRCTYPINIGFKNFCPNCGSDNSEVEE